MLQNCSSFFPKSVKYKKKTTSPCLHAALICNILFKALCSPLNRSPIQPRFSVKSGIQIFPGNVLVYVSSLHVAVGSVETVKVQLSSMTASCSRGPFLSTVLFHGSPRESFCSSAKHSLTVLFTVCVVVRQSSYGFRLV